MKDYAGEAVSEKSKTKFHSVMIDKRLCWKDHILCISGNIASCNSESQKYVMKDSLITLYYSVVYLYLIDCNYDWGIACKTYIKT